MVNDCDFVAKLNFFSPESEISVGIKQEVPEKVRKVFVMSLRLSGH